jgi:hypothetical protein
MKDGWKIVVPNHECPWHEFEVGKGICMHEENSTYCAEDYCPIKRGKEAKTPFRKHLERSAEIARNYPVYKRSCLGKTVD